jgi:hypothetical protein
VVPLFKFPYIPGDTSLRYRENSKTKALGLWASSTSMHAHGGVGNSGREIIIT